MAVEPDVVLLRHARFRCPDDRTFEQPDLRLDDVDAGDDFGHRMFDLDARVHFDEVEFVRIGIEQELDRACAAVIGGLAEPQCGTREIVAHLP